jgi:hypothetical protein
MDIVAWTCKKPRKPAFRQFDLFLTQRRAIVAGDAEAVRIDGESRASIGPQALGVDRSASG